MSPHANECHLEVKNQQQRFQTNVLPLKMDDALKILDNLQDIVNGKSTVTEICPDVTLTYHTYQVLVEGLRKMGQNIQKTLPIIIHQIDESYHIPNKISNLTTKVNKFVANGGNSNELLKLKCLVLEIPNELAKAGLTADDFLGDSLSTFTKLTSPVELNYNTILFMRRFIYQHNKRWSDAIIWIKYLMQLSDDDMPSEPTMRKQWNTLHSSFLKLRTCSKHQQLDCFLNNIYRIPKRQLPPSNSQYNENKNVSIRDRNIIQKLEDKVIQAYQKLSDYSTMIENLLTENMEQEKKIKQHNELKKDFSKKCTELNELKLELASVNTRNYNRKLKRRNEKINEIRHGLERKEEEVNQIKDEMDELQDKNKALEEDITRLNEKLTELHQNRLKEQKMKSYYKLKCDSVKTNSNRVSENETKKLKKENDDLKKIINEISDELKSELNDQNKQKLNLFQNGKYSEEIRIVYMDLLRMGVSVENCKNVVQSVLKNLLNLDVDRLPQKSLASLIAVEASIIAQAQAASIMLESDCNTLHLDGTKKHFVEYGGFQVSTDSGSYSLGLQEMSSGHASSYMEATVDTFQEMAEAISEKNTEIEITKAKLMMSVKNIMTDRHVVNKSYKSLFESAKTDYALKAHPEMSNLSEGQFKEQCSVNALFCGLHILPNMATAALKGLKQFENENGVNHKGFLSINSVASDLIFQVCKAFIPTSGDQKSGDALEYQDFLHENKIKNHLVTFLHNRFNVLFLDGGAVYYHKSQIQEYLSSGRCTKNNKLLATIKESITNTNILSECRALGIIEKIICTPLFRLLEDKNLTYFDMNIFWEQLCDAVARFAIDATPLIKGIPVFDTGIYPCRIVKDEVYDALFKTNEKLDKITVNVLQELCKSMEPVLKRQLSNFLPGGDMNKPSAKLLTETKSAPKTNKIAEADFSDLDRLTKSAPQKSTVTKSGCILFTKNKTSSFLQTACKSKRHKYMTIARKMASRRMREQQGKSGSIRLRRLALQHERMEKRERHVLREKENRDKLVKQMKEQGIWVCGTDITKTLCGYTIAKKKVLIRNQILFHTKVLNSNIPNKKFTKFQDCKHVFTINELIDNLRQIITANYSDIIPEHVKNVNANIQQSAIAISASRTKQVRRAPKRGIESNRHETEMPPKNVKIEWAVDQFYAVSFTDAWYPGRCLEIINDTTAKVSYLKRFGASFKWPLKPDIQITYIDGVLSKVNIVPISNGRLWQIENSHQIENLYRKGGESN